MGKNLEVELKFKLLNIDAVIKFLTSHADFKDKSFQHDIYYNAPDHDFLEDRNNISEWLRIRIEKDKAQINYKDWHPAITQSKPTAKSMRRTFNRTNN